MRISLLLLLLTLGCNLCSQVGYFGQNGLYATGAGNVPSDAHYDKALEFWKTWLQSNNVALLPNSTTTQASLTAALADASNTRTCTDAVKYPWCLSGRFTTPQCSAIDCPDVQLYRPDWATLQFEQLISNTGLKLNIVFLGTAMQAKLITAAAAGTPGLWYSFTPTQEVAQLNIKRVTFPAHDATQYIAGAPNRWNTTGIIATDLPAQALGKIVRAGLKTEAPDIYELITRLSLKETYLNQMMAKLPRLGSGVSTTDSDMETAACGWLKNNTEIWKGWLPTVWQCPPGTLYDAASNTCAKCPAGKISTLYAATECIPCGVGLAPNAEATTCIKGEEADMTFILAGGVGGFVVFLILIFSGQYYYASHKEAEKKRLQAEAIAKRKAAMGSQGEGEDIDLPKGGACALVDTDVESSTALWDWDPVVMSEALLLHDAVLRDALKAHGGLELATEGDAFVVCFSDPVNGVKWALQVQTDLMNVKWPERLAKSGNVSSATEMEGGAAIFCGLRVRMGLEVGELVMAKASQINDDPVMVNCRKMSDFAHGGQILISNHALAATFKGLPSDTSWIAVGDVANITADDEGDDEKSGLAAVQVLPGLLEARTSEFIPMYDNELKNSVMPPSGEITCVFTGSGSGKLASAEAKELLDDTISTCADSNQGYVCKGSGGKFMVAFQRPEQAASFSMSLQKELMKAPWDEATIGNEHCAPFPLDKPLIQGPA